MSDNLIIVKMAGDNFYAGRYVTYESQFGEERPIFMDLTIKTKRLQLCCLANEINALVKLVLQRELTL